ncbi:hypothetical protein [Rhizobium sp. GR12]|uniref:hypothetical protein n=1 Tax=Rhizobium sp. GR12 TaxID=3053925 RepID=UPI002FBDDE4D
MRSAEARLSGCPAFGVCHDRKRRFLHTYRRARLTDREVEKLLSNIRLGSFTTPDEQEVAGYAEVMETGFSAYEAISFWGGFSLLSKARCNPVLA